MGHRGPGSPPPRGKELKFAATDLKLLRRGLTTEIDGWDAWRRRQLPYCYFLWGARLGGHDSIDRMVREVQPLTKTYLDGAGLAAWRENDTKTGYVPVRIPSRDPSDRVSTVDEMLRHIGSEIKALAPQGRPPAPVEPAGRPVEPSTLAPDTTTPSD